MVSMRLSAPVVVVALMLLPAPGRSAAVRLRSTRISSFSPGGVEHPRHVARVPFEIHEGKMIARGTIVVDDGFSPCADRVPVALERLVDGRWQSIRSTEADSNGDVLLRARSRPGRYRIHAPEVVIGEDDVRDVCVAASSSSWKLQLVRRYRRIGESVQGRKIGVWELGNPRAQPILLVGCIHGNECAGLPVVRNLIRDALPRTVRLFIIPNLNPDGYAARTRQNARGVDLNRNFRHLWRRITDPVYYSGPHPLSEPETRVARRFIRERRPRITIWFHQAMNEVLGPFKGAHAPAPCYARLVQQAYRREPPTPGGATTWQNHALPETTAFLHELPHWGALSREEERRYTGALRKLIRWYGKGAREPCPT
jgi:murein peptide amidase A